MLSWKLFKNYQTNAYINLRKTYSAVAYLEVMGNPFTFLYYYIFFILVYTAGRITDDQLWY